MPSKRSRRGGCSLSGRCLVLWFVPLLFLTLAPMGMLLQAGGLGGDAERQVDIAGDTLLPMLVLSLVALSGALLEGSGLRCGSSYLALGLGIQAMIILAWLAVPQMSLAGEGAMGVIRPKVAAKVAQLRGPAVRRTQGASSVPALDTAAANALDAAAPLDRGALPPHEVLAAAEATATDLGPAPGPTERPQPGRGKISVVLPCANEGHYTVQTVWSFCNRTPAEYLQEIIVVDDGSSPPLEEILEDAKRHCPLKVMRHESTMGLMVAKQTGGDAALGEFLGFFDCHVAPNLGWYKEIIQHLKEKSRRLVVPQIGDLDLDTWDEKPHGASNSKCYINWDAEFMWYEDTSDYIAVISGGLVATTKQWWTDSGGFDHGMRGWGGENVDQSLRVWLCGGDIVRAKSSRVAHMWRVPEDKRTTAHYRAVRSTDNNARVAAAWFDAFRGKFRDGALLKKSPDVSEILERKQALQCKPFGYFLHRFRHVYRDGGMLPERVFRIKVVGQDLCLLRSGGVFRMAGCGKATWFHMANQNRDDGHRCCSGIRQWNTLECFDRLDPSGPLPYFCDVVGGNQNQLYSFENGGLIRHQGSRCLSARSAPARAPNSDRPPHDLEAADCSSAVKWEQVDAFEPEETRLYREAVEQFQLSDDIPDN